MKASRRAWLIGMVLCLGAALAAPASLWACDHAAQAQAADKAEAADAGSGAGMADCPYAKKGECCGACQQGAAAAEEGAAKPMPADCPCKRAKEAARQGS